MRLIACLAAGVLLIAATRSVPNAATPAPGEWPSYGRNYAEQRFSPLDAISTNNVKQLGLAWSYDFRVGRGIEGTPLMVDGVLYATSAWSIVYAVDARTGKELWVYDPHADPVQAAKSCCDAVNRGVAYLDGKIFVGAIDGRLIALDAKTGKPLWDVQTVDKTQPYTITGAPRAAKGLVFIGNGGADMAGVVRGYASAYDAETGKLAWRFYTVPGDPAKGPDGAASDSAMPMAAKTWHGHWWTYGGGGTVWDSITYDPELDRVYIGVGNGSPWNQQVRSPGGGDNLFLASIVAVDRKTGHYIWHYQATPGDTWDHTATQSIVLATMDIAGKKRRVIIQAPKNGFFYVIDRDTGKLLSAKNIVPMAKAADTPPGEPVSWAYGIDMKTGRPLQNPEARYLDGSTSYVHPVSSGAHPWTPMAFDPRSDIAFLPVQDRSSRYKSDPNYKTLEWAASAALLPVAPPPGAKPPPPSASAALLAWDVRRQQPLWKLAYPYGPGGGALATAGNLVFAANGAPALVAYDSRTGAKLWSYDIQAGAQGGAISYAIDGEQYIAIEAGNGGSDYMVARPFLPDKPAPEISRLLVFKLGGTAHLPELASALPPMPEPPVIDADTPTLQLGAMRYGYYCSRCHGMGASSRRVVPDLRRSAMIQTAEAFRAVVHDGALQDRGMPSFGDIFTVAEVDAIRAWLASVAATQYAREHGQVAKTPTPAGPNIVTH